MLSTCGEPSRSHGIRTAWLLIVMPRSRSMSIRSRYCARIDRSSTTPVICSMRSARVDLPWSMWAMMQKLRIASCGVACGCSAMRARGDTSGWVPCVGGQGTVLQCPTIHGCRSRTPQQRDRPVEGLAGRALDVGPHPDALPGAAVAGVPGPGHRHGELELGVHGDALARVGPATGALPHDPAPTEQLHVEGQLLPTRERRCRGEHD